MVRQLHSTSSSKRISCKEVQAVVAAVVVVVVVVAEVRYFLLSINPFATTSSTTVQKHLVESLVSLYSLLAQTNHKIVFTY